MAKGSRLSSRPDIPPIGAGKRILFTGPDGTGDYRSKLPEDTHYVGTTSASLENSSDAAYLWRPAPYNLPPVWHKCCFVGEIGWGMDIYLRQRGRYRTKLLMMLEPFPPLEEYELINQYSNPRWKIPPPPADPQFFSWEDFPIYHPSVPIMARSEQSHCQVKS